MKQINVRTHLKALVVLIFITSIAGFFSNYLVIPTSKWLYEALLTVSTFGFKYFNNSFYQNVALRLYRDPAVLTKQYMLIILSVFIVFVMYYLFRFLEDLKRSNNDDKKVDDEYKIIEDMSEEEMAEWLQKKEIFYEKNRRKYILRFRILLVILIVNLLVVCTQVAMLQYQCILVRDFRQKFTIAKVLMDEGEEEEILCKFTVIKSKQDYLDIMNELKQKAEVVTENIHSKKKRIAE